MYREKFFGSEGITSTSANHICNIAKELYKEKELFLKNISFVNESISTLTSENKKLIRKEIPIEKFIEIEDTILKIARLKSLIAYLKEAVKEKDNAMNYYLYSYSLTTYLKEYNIESPTLKAPKEVDRTDYFNTLELEEIVKYFKVEAYAATFGAYIHPSGDVAKARTEYLNVSNKPIDVEKDGVNSIITSYNSSLELKDIENLFQKLQNTHREYQKEVNSMKFEEKKFITETNTDLLRNYSIESDNYRMEQNNLATKHKLYIKEKVAEISQLKIIIPSVLKPIVDEINSLGK